MEKHTEPQIALYTPNLVNICVDDDVDGNLSGRLYHCYTEEPWQFDDMVKLIQMMENFFDSIGYPQASTQIRNFLKNMPQGNCVKLEKKTTQDDIIQYRGKKASFLVHVQYRQNSSWQGTVKWIEKDVVKTFQSELNLMKLINGALEI